LIATAEWTDHDPNWVGYLIGTAHGWFGKALVLLGLVEIYLGLALYCVPTYTMVLGCAHARSQHVR
jgi:hypothetical protein